MFEWIFTTNGCLATNGCLCILWCCFMNQERRYEQIVERCDKLERKLNCIDINKW